MAKLERLNVLTLSEEDIKRGFINSHALIGVNIEMLVVPDIYHFLKSDACKAIREHILPQMAQGSTLVQVTNLDNS